MTTYQCPGCGGAIVGAEVCPDCRMQFPANVETVEDAMTTDDLRALLAKATPGPWDADGWTGTVRGAGVQFTGEHDAVWAKDESGEWTLICPTGLRDEPQSNENAQLIVAAVNALPALLDRLEAAERRFAYVEQNMRYEPDMGGNHKWWRWQPCPFPRGLTFADAVDAAREPK